MFKHGFFVLGLQKAVFIVDQLNLSLSFLIFLSQAVHLTVMGNLKLIHLFSVLGHIIIVLISKSLNGIVEFKFIFSLDRKDFILQFGNVSLQVVFRILMIFKLTFVTGVQKVDLLILLHKSGVEVVNLFQHGLFDELSQLSDIANSVFSLVDNIAASFTGIIFILAMILSDFISQGSGQLLESIDFRVLLFFDVLQFVGKGTFNNFFHGDYTLELIDFLLGPLSDISVLLLQSLDFFVEGFLQGLSFLLTLTG